MSAETGWRTLRVEVAPHSRDAVIAALFAGGAQGIHDEGSAVMTSVDAGFDVHALAAAARDAGAAATSVTDTPVIDWSEAWKDRIGSHELGPLVVAPPWLAGGFDPATTIVIEPGMAFGTGEHATTRGVVRLLAGVLRKGDRVADLGAGSAVLAIAAAKLGASRVSAIEIDPDAIGNAEENVVRNGVSDVVTVIEGDAALLLPLVKPVRVILANIISSVLVQLLPVIGDALDVDGHAILSGVLQEERDELVALLERSGWHVQAEDREDIWWSGVIARR
ncbi:MAG: prmA [Gemmatimonadetes bacterium]|nr:prmA [Gemmatimonadota bacterium]